MPRALWWFQGGGLFILREVPLYWGTSLTTNCTPTIKCTASKQRVNNSKSFKHLNLKAKAGIWP